MSLQLSVNARNASLDAIETLIGASPILTLRTGAVPANCAAANAGSVLATVNLPADWMSAASAGAKAKSGSWDDLSADASGKPSHFRVHDSSGAVCHMQGIAAGPWVVSTAYAVGDHVINDGGKVYRCTAAGTSAASGGPTGTGGAITDNGATWAYVQAAADMVLNLSGAAGVTLGQTFSVSSFLLSAGAA